jgi:hypothetical protein
MNCFNKRGDLSMTLPANDALAAVDVLAKHELSADELEAIAAGSPLMSGAPNSINGTLRVQPLPPHPPRYWMGGSVHSPGLRLF